MSVGLEQPWTVYQRFTNRLTTVGKEIGLISDPQVGSCLPQLRTAFTKGQGERTEHHLDRLASPANSRLRSIFFESKAATKTNFDSTREVPEAEAHQLILNIIRNGDDKQAQLAMSAY